MQEEAFSKHKNSLGVEVGHFSNSRVYFFIETLLKEKDF
jgi:hypothetical protein